MPRPPRRPHQREWIQEKHDHAEYGELSVRVVEGLHAAMKPERVGLFEWPDEGGPRLVYGAIGSAIALHVGRAVVGNDLELGVGERQSPECRPCRFWRERGRQGAVRADGIREDHPRFQNAASGSGPKRFVSPTRNGSSPRDSALWSRAL